MDQIFAQAAGYIARHEFDNIDECVELLDSATKPIGADSHRKSASSTAFFNRHAHAQKLDETADWKEWVLRLGIRLSGLRNLGGLNVFSWVMLDSSASV